MRCIDPRWLGLLLGALFVGPGARAQEAVLLREGFEDEAGPPEPRSASSRPSGSAGSPTGPCLTCAGTTATC